MINNEIYSLKDVSQHIAVIRSRYMFIKEKMNKILTLLLFLLSFFASAQSVSDLNKEKYYKLEINQFDYAVMNSYPQTVIDVKNKKKKSIIKLKTHGTLNEYNSIISNTNAETIMDAKKYLQSSELIDYTEENIELIYNKLQLSELSEFHCAKVILNFLSAVIKYDRKLAEEISSGLCFGRPASWVLENQRGTCGEYTNLFIALMRLRGIPCKFITGLYYSETQTSFHAWAEFYDVKTGWIAVDPQGGIIGISSNHIKLKEGIDYIDTGFDMTKCNCSIKEIKK